jgi:3-phenylpropionate/trans-cinnamate dioxygenase ferredoxin reductase subunit
VWSDQYDWKVNAFGWRDPDGESIVIGDLAGTGKAAVVHTNAEGGLTGAATVNWVRALNQVRRLHSTDASAETVVDTIRRLI